jgi:hypothetical protein
MLVGVSGDAQLSNLVRDFKRIATRIVKIDWQRNFFDHRLRRDESLAEKFEYIRQNPVRVETDYSKRRVAIRHRRAIWI